MTHSFPIDVYLLLVAVGLFAGVFGGLLGIGGSLIMIPALTELLGPDQHLYQAAAMIVNFFVVVPAVVQHRRQGTIERSTVVQLVPLAALAVILGVLASEAPFFKERNEPYLRLLFGLFLFADSIVEFRRLFVKQPSERLGLEPPPAGDRPQRARWRFTAAVALPTGFIGGLLGVGGGVLAVPLQRRFLRVPIRSAIANSASMIIATSLIGATVKNYAYVSAHDASLRSFVLAGVLIPTAILGSMMGSRLMYRLPVRAIRTLFCILFAVVAIRFVFGAIESIQTTALAMT